MPHQEKALRRYIFPTTRHAMPGCVSLAIFLPFTFLIAQEGDAPFTLAFAAFGLVVTLFLFWQGLIRPMRAFNAMLDSLADHMPEILADFETATELPGLCRVGQHYLFGCGKYLIADLTTTTGLSLQYEVYTSPRSEKEDQLRTRYVCRIGPDTLCEVDGSMETRLKLRELVTLLHGKCPIDKEAYTYCVLWDKERNAPKL